MIEFLGLLLVAGVSVAILMRLNARRRQRAQIKRRLSRWLDEWTQRIEPAVITKSQSDNAGSRMVALVPALSRLTQIVSQSGFAGRGREVLFLSVALGLIPPAVCAILDLDIKVGALIGLCLAAGPVGALTWRAAARRTKFNEQLPDAIDLMVSVLKSGHSVPQAVKTVSDELPNPVGAEFSEVVQRMNLGQPLSQALSYSCQRFASYDLDLIRRAVAIQAEVGGSLGELLEKTNNTLRQRLKLARQVRVLTAQSRLTAIIVALMPIILALALQHMSPGYLRPLFDTELGRILLVAAVVFQVLGIYIMRQISVVKV